MNLLFATIWFPLLIALLIGIATAWWLWAYPEPDWDYVDEDIVPYVSADDPHVQIFSDLGSSLPPQPIIGTSVDAGMAPDIDAEAFMAPPHPFTRIAPAQGAPDDLMLLKGVGPKLNALLTGLGITRFDQIAAWTQEDIAAIDPHLEPFSGRVEREDWVGQAKLLAAGDMAGFEAKYGKA